jgi:CBS domain containing-hemolysin-like protein
MSDPEPPSRHGPGGRGARRRGLLGLIQFFRGGAETAADDADRPLSEAGGELVTQARAFQDLRVEDVMKPRADIVAIERSCGFGEVVQRFLDAEHSRMPVYKETLDEPVGVVHVKDVFRLLARRPRQPKPEDRVLTGRHHLVREVLYVPPSMPTAKLLASMRARRIHMALVIDEFGGVDGLVTLEDLLESLVGEIDDEHDEAADQGYDPILEDDDGWIVDGRAPLEELEHALGEGVDLASEDLDEEIDTVAGLVNAMAGRVPQKRERLEHPAGFTLEVLAADPRRVKRLRVRRVAPAQASSAEA